MNYPNTQFDLPSKMTRDSGIFANMILTANREAEEMKRQEERYGEPKLVEDNNERD